MAPLPPPAADPAAPSQLGDRFRVLVVEDYPDQADSLCLLLDLAGFRPLAVTDGLDAPAAVDRFDPHVVLLDLALPGCDGAEVARRLLNRPSHRRPRVVVLTAFTDAARRAHLTRLGVDGYLLKPADPGEVIEWTRRLCAGPRTEQKADPDGSDDAPPGPGPVR